MEPDTNGMSLQEIDLEYRKFYAELKSYQQSTIRSTPKGFWAHFPLSVYVGFFKKAGLSNYRSFIDLGSGDGKVTLAASLFTKAVGLEIDKELFRKSVEIRDKLGLNCRFLNMDFLEHNLSGYDLIFINPDKGFHNGIEDKLLRELNGDLFVCNDIFLPRFLKRQESLWVGQIPFIRYTM